MLYLHSVMAVVYAVHKRIKNKSLGSQIKYIYLCKLGH